MKSMYSHMLDLFDPLCIIEKLIDRSEDEIGVLKGIGKEFKESKDELFYFKNTISEEANSALAKHRDAYLKVEERSFKIASIYEKVSNLLNSFFKKEFFSKYRHRIKKEKLEEIEKRINGDKIRFLKIMGDIDSDYVNTIAEQANNNPNSLLAHQKIIEEENQRIMYR